MNVMSDFELIDVNIFGQFIKQLGGFYESYGDSIIACGLGREEFHQCIADNTLWQKWECFLTKELHLKMIQINMQYLQLDPFLCKSLVSPPLPPPPAKDKDDDTPPSTSETLPFPQEGISLAAVDTFIELCGGAEMLRDMTTTEVNNEALMPLTYAYKTSYCGLLEKQRREKCTGDASLGGVQGSDEDDIKVEQDVVFNKPCAFISHAWKYKFLDVMDAIKSHFEWKTQERSLLDSTASDSHGEEGLHGQTKEVIIWFDLFTNNQHLAPDLDFHWWSTTFKTAIRNIGRTVMVLSPWENPVPFTRAWCLFEIYCTVETKTTFEVAMCEEQKESFIKAASDDIMKLRKMISVIDVAKSEAWNPLDLSRIFAVVQQTVGMAVINATVLEECRQWLISTVGKEVQLATTEHDRLKLTNTLGLLYYEKGEYENAFTTLKSCLDDLNAIEGAESHASIQRINNLAIMMDKQGRCVEACDLFQQCLDLYAATLGTEVPDYYHTMNSLAVSRLQCGEYEESLPLFQKCLDYFQTALGEKHLSALNAMGNMGIILDSTGRPEEALAYFEKAVKLYNEVLGPAHVDTLRWTNSLGVVYNKLGRATEALELHLKTYEQKVIKFGRSHSSTVLSMNNSCQLIIDTQDWGRVPVLEDWLEGYRDSPEGIGRSAWALMYTITLIYLNLARYDDCHALCGLLLNSVKEILDEGDPLIDAYSNHCKNCIEIEHVEVLFNSLPDIVHQPDFHEHPLAKMNCPYENDFMCDVCEVASRGYVYHCEVCGFDAHLECVPHSGGNDSEDP